METGVLATGLDTANPCRLRCEHSHRHCHDVISLVQVAPNVRSLALCVWGVIAVWHSVSSKPPCWREGHGGSAQDSIAPAQRMVLGGTPNGQTTPHTHSGHITSRHHSTLGQGGWRCKQRCKGPQSDKGHVCRAQQAAIQLIPGEHTGLHESQLTHPSQRAVGAYSRWHRPHLRRARNWARQTPHVTHKPPRAVNPGSEPQHHAHASAKHDGAAHSKSRAMTVEESCCMACVPDKPACSGEHRVVKCFENGSGAKFPVAAPGARSKRQHGGLYYFWGTGDDSLSQHTTDRGGDATHATATLPDSL